MRIARLVAFGCLVASPWLVSCAGGATTSPAGQDVPVALDSGALPDVAAPETLEPAPDLSAPPDVAPGGAFGPIDGACGTVTAELASATPTFLETTWHLTPATLDPATLRPGAKARFDGENAGGSSKCSEVMSVQLLYECEGATLWKREIDVVYDAEGSITDWVADFAGTHVGVSVTRAYKGPQGKTFTAEDATTLLTKKLAGINESTANVSAADAWVKQILHVWTLQPEWVPVLRSAWEGLDATLRADTVILVTVEDGAGWIVTDSCDD